MGDLIDNLSGGMPLKIPFHYNVSGKYYSLKVGNTTLSKHNIDWNNGAVDVIALKEN